MQVIGIVVKAKPDKKDQPQCERKKNNSGKRNKGPVQAIVFEGCCHVYGFYDFTPMGNCFSDIVNIRGENSVKAPFNCQQETRGIKETYLLKSSPVSSPLPALRQCRN